MIFIADAGDGEIIWDSLKLDTLFVRHEVVLKPAKDFAISYNAQKRKSAWNFIINGCVPLARHLEALQAYAKALDSPAAIGNGGLVVALRRGIELDERLASFKYIDALASTGSCKQRFNDLEPLITPERLNYMGGLYYQEILETSEYEELYAQGTL